MYRDEIAMSRHRELALQQQQQQLMREREREREVRHREAQQQLYAQSSDFFDGRGSFVANELVPGLRPPAQRNDRDLYNSDRLDERLAFAAHGRVPGVPGGGYEQMMRNMSLNAPVRGNANIYSTGNGQGSMPVGGGSGLSGQMAAELAQQQQQRERQRQLQIERAQLLAMQGNQQLGGRNPGGNVQSQLGPRGNPLDQFNRGGRIPVNDLQQQQFGGFNGLGGAGIGPPSAGVGNLNVSSGGFPNGGMPGGNTQLNTINSMNVFDGPGRQPPMSLAQQRQGNLGNLPMGYSGSGGGVESRFGQQNQMHGLGMHNPPQMSGGSGSGAGQHNDLISLFLAGSQGNQQN